MGRGLVPHCKGGTRAGVAVLEVFLVRYEADESQLWVLAAGDRNKLAGTSDRFLTAVCLDDKKVVLAVCFEAGATRPASEDPNRPHVESG